MKQDFKFNDNACSVNDLNPGCKELWTIGQQEAIRRRSVKTRIAFKSTASYEVVKNFSVRAERIAANYAKIYLEQENNGKPNLKGRFYWTGLAAFASEQVMCALDYASSSKWRYLPPAVPPFEITKLYLGKGNFWLFQDIFVWHWFYINHPEQFKKCINDRNWENYTDCFKSAFKELPWLNEALQKINNLKKTDYLEQGFDFISQVERYPEGELRQRRQLASLMAIANHEQLMILQPLIYESKDFKALLNSQALMEGHFGVPRRLAAMSTACETNDEEYDSVMTEGKLHDANDRMKFITDIAKNYHRLMKAKSKYMLENLQTIAGWSDNV